MASWWGSPEIKVGIMVIAVGGLVGGMAMKVAEGPKIFGGSKRYHFYADDAGGLVRNSAVKMAGIKVGIIDDIALENGRAKVFIALDSGTPMSTGTKVELKADGILGDKHVELTPPQGDLPDLPTGREVPTGNLKGGMDDVMSEVSRLAKNMNTLIDTLNSAARNQDSTTTIGRIVMNIEKITDDLKQVTGENKDKVREIVEHVRNLTKNIDTYINEESLARVDRSLKNIEEITSKVNRGEGTLGRLVNDEQTVEELNTAITNVNKFLGGADKMETSVDFHSEFLADDHNKSYLGLKIQPGLDRYYELQVISDSQGVKRTTTSVTSANGGANNTYNETTTYKNKFKVTGLFAKNFWDFTVKGGLIENYGGVGVDYYMFHRTLRASVEVFNFNELQLRAFLRYNFFKGVYVMGGGDNLLNNDGGIASGFIGAGIFITNDDLKMFASKLSF